MTLRGTGILAAATLAALLAAPPALAGGRVALLVGEGGYPGQPGQTGVWPHLPNAVHDVELVARALQADGFQTTIVKDAGGKEIAAAVQAFALKAADADAAVFYYSGHGFEYGRVNYLAPVDAPTAVSADALADRFVSVDGIVNLLAGAGKANIFFIDACRTGAPFVSAGPAAQAAPISDIEYPEGAPLAVVYSTARGEPALDAAPPPNDYSPFAYAVAQDIVIPRVEFGYFAEQVRADVEQRTRAVHPQWPFWEVSLDPGFYFRLDRAPRAQAVRVARVARHSVGAGAAAAREMAAAPPPAPTPAPLQLDPQMLATTNAPQIVLQVLHTHSAEDLEALAQQGDVQAMVVLADMFELGIGVGADLARAKSLMEQAAAQHFAQGELELAVFLEAHPAAPGDADRALALYQAAADQGFAKAQGQLGQAYWDGRFGGGRSWDNVRKGLTLMRQSAAGGYPYAMFALALRGEDAAERARWTGALRALAAGGDTRGDQELCELAAQQGQMQAALASCRVAADAGDSTARARLAIAYHDGRGVAASDDEALHWTRLALGQADLRADLRARLLGFGYTLHRPRAPGA